MQQHIVDVLFLQLHKEIANIGEVQVISQEPERICMQEHARARRGRSRSSVARGNHRAIHTAEFRA